MDHCARQKREINPRETANIFSLVSFVYIWELVKKAFKHDLKDEDLYEVLKSCNSERCGEEFEKTWNLAKNKNNENKNTRFIFKLMWKRWGQKCILYGVVNFVWRTGMSIIQPYALSSLVAYFVPGSNVTRSDAYFYACLVTTQLIIHIIFLQNYILLSQIFGVEVKTTLSSMLYRKALKLSPVSSSQVTFGNIVTIITKDVETFKESVLLFNELWNSMMQVVIICVLLYLRLGPLSFVGIGIMLLVLPLQTYLSKCVISLRLKTNKKTDKRLQVTQEILSSMKIIKMYTWESFFASKVNYTRREEMNKLLLGLYLKVVTVIIGVLFSKIGFYLMITACIWAGITTDPTIIVYALSNFTDLRTWLGEVIPNRMGKIADLISAYKRIDRALRADELTPLPRQDEICQKPFVELQEATVNINDQEVLSKISFKFTTGLTLITGTVGSGKSLLFRTIVQDFPLNSGLLATSGKISYASQDPWLFPSSIKQNILFGEKYDKIRYQEVVRVCALLFDFNLLERGDETILTDRGLNLSKGQQARINLARAIYRDTEIYLLDDCLTALDATVQDYIFRECIQKFLTNKICILISQTENHISQADNVIIMDKGKIKQMGKPDARIIQNIHESVVEYEALDKEVMDKANEEEVNEKTELMESEQQIAKKKVYAEVKKEGSIDFEVYKKYFMYGGGLLMFVLLFFGCGSAQLATSYSDKLLTRWVDNKQLVLSLELNSTVNITSNVPTLEDAIAMEQRTFKYYSILIFVSAALELLRIYILADFCRRSAINIHKDLVTKIMNAVMSFFDTHLIGNVLNRFSQDLVNVDEYLPLGLNICLTMLFGIAGGVSLIISVNPYFAIFVVIVSVILVTMRWIFLAAGRSLKRLEAATRSPMVGHINATLEGLTTIRVCKVENLLIEEYDKHQDLHTSARIMCMCTMRALGFFLNMIASLFIIVVIVKFLFFEKHPSAGDVALALTQVMKVGGQIQQLVREWAELENLMTSVERILEYTEIKLERKEGRLIEGWPNRGAITYEKVSLSYNGTDDLVLSNLSFIVKPNEKIGIVGRTGAGKSSIIATIFRLYEVQGKITIDGIDIKTLPIELLRKSIAIIPQDPVIFSGTIRSNLDALQEFKDIDLWNALEKVGMKKYITSLQQKVNYNDENFSSGQKQLICLARAILRKNKIVVLDEATANMDSETDAVLNGIIRENFCDATVLTIAHRLHSILKCDKVMLLDRGHIKEFNKPSTLLKDKNGMFYKMVQRAGLLICKE